MNFEEAYKKYKDGSASDEEKAFVEAEIEKAKKISALLDCEPSGESEDVIKPAESELIKKAKKAFFKKTTLRTIFITVICLVVLTGIACGAVFGTAYYCASKSVTVSEQQANEIAKKCVAEFTGSNENSIIKSTECELEMEINLTNSIFVYEIKMLRANSEYEVEVNSVSGYAVITDIDEENEHEHDNDTNGRSKRNSN